MRPAIALLFLLASAARGDVGPVTDSDPDVEVARRHFEHGLELYMNARYSDAIGEFEAARRLKPLPALGYNIARCYDRMERWQEALAEYERYTQLIAPVPPDRELQERIQVLQDRIRAAGRRSRPRRFVWPGGVLAGALGIGIIAAALDIHVAVRLPTLTRDYEAAPTPEGQDEGRRLRGMSVAADVLFAVAAAAAVVDVALWVRAARRKSVGLAAAIAPAGGAVAIQGRF